MLGKSSLLALKWPVLCQTVLSVGQTWSIGNTTGVNPP
jgi:hypothetical protein